MAFNIMDAIKNRPEQATPPEVKSDGKIKIEYISVKNIVPAKAKRNYYSTEDIETLKASIAVHGIKQNLLVKAIEDGKYELIAGERRWRASSALLEEGLDDCEFVPCTVERPIDDLDQRLLLTTTNSTARELTDYEKGLQVKEMNEILDEYERRGATIETPRRELIMKHFGLTSGQVARYTAIHNNLTEAFTKEYVKKEIGVSIAYEISRLPETRQAEAYRLYIEQGGLSIKDVKKIQEADKEDLAELERQGQEKLEELTEPENEEMSESDTENDDEEYEDKAINKSEEPESATNVHGVYLEKFIKNIPLEIPKKYGEITIHIAHDPKDDKYRTSYSYRSKSSGRVGSPHKNSKPFDSENEAFTNMIDKLHTIDSEEIKAALQAGGYTKEQVTTQVREIEIVEPEKETATMKPDEKKSYAEMTPCEQCRAANSWCKELHCCKTCEEPCNNRQICRIDDPPEKRQAEKDEYNRQTQEQWQAVREKESEAPDIEAAQRKITAAKYTMDILIKSIDKCGELKKIEEDEGNEQSAQLESAKVEYLGKVLGRVKKDLFEMTENNMFKE